MTASDRPRLLDGAMGTELMRRGYEMRGPLWGAGAVVDAPELVAQIHAEYANAGAEVLRTNTFGLSAASADLSAAAVETLRRAAAGRAVAGAIGPADPAWSRTERDEHYGVLGRALRGAGVDVLIAETQTSLGGAHEASEALGCLGIPLWIALSCEASGHTLSGEPLSTASVEADVVLVGCTEATALAAALTALRGGHPATGLGLVPSTACTRNGALDPAGTPELAVVDAVSDELAAGLAVVGGCCGTTPAFTAALRTRLDTWFGPAPGSSAS